MKIELCDVCMANEKKLSIAKWISKVKRGSLSAKVAVCKDHKNYVNENHPTIEQIEVLTLTAYNQSNAL